MSLCVRERDIEKRGRKKRPRAPADLGDLARIAQGETLIFLTERKTCKTMKVKSRKGEDQKNI